MRFPWKVFFMTWGLMILVWFWGFIGGVWIASLH